VPKGPLPKDDFRIVVRRERLINGVRLHVKTTARAVEEASNREQSVLRATGYEIERRSSAEDDSIVRAPQPLDTEPFRRKQNPESLLNPEHRGYAREDVDIKREGTMLASLLAPAVIGGPGGITEDQKTLLFRQSPQIRNGQKGP
jgi:hypothetical protein